MWRYNQYDALSSWGSIQKLFFVFGMTVLLAACSEAEVVEHVEAFTVETSSDTPNSSGFYVKTGYQLVNSVTYFKQWDDKLEVETSSIEDFYDLNGNYVHTIVSYTFSKEMKWHNIVDSKKEQVELMEPTTILTPELDLSVIIGETKNLTDEEKERVRTHVFKYVEGLK